MRQVIHRPKTSSWMLLLAVVVACTSAGCAGNRDGRADGSATVSGSVRMVFHVRAHMNEGTDAERAITEAYLFWKRNPTAKIVVIVDDCKSFDRDYNVRRATELLQGGQGVETAVPNAWGQRPKESPPEGVRVVPDIYLRIDELTKAGWTYVHL